MRKNFKKYITVKCNHCETLINKELKEYTRQIKRGKKKFYCNASCSAKENPAIIAAVKFSKENPQVFSQRLKEAKLKNPDLNWGLTKYSPFRYYLWRANSLSAKKKYGDSDLTLDYLKELWNLQNGKCFYSGKIMFLPKSTRDANSRSNSPLRASLDRIDSSKGYVQGNVEFVCLAVNLAKNRFSRDDMMAFFAKV